MIHESTEECLEENREKGDTMNLKYIRDREK